MHVRVLNWPTVWQAGTAPPADRFPSTKELHVASSLYLSFPPAEQAWVGRSVENGLRQPRILKCLCFVVFCDEWEMQTSENQPFLF